MGATTLPIWLPVVQVGIGGFLAIFGGVVTQLLTHLFALRRDRDSIRQQRIERLVKALYAYTTWLENKRSVEVFRSVEYAEPSPLDEAQMLQNLYFPEVRSELGALMQGDIPIHQWIADQRIAHMRDEKAWIGAYVEAPFATLYKRHLATRAVLVAKLRGLM